MQANAELSKTIINQIMVWNFNPVKANLLHYSKQLAFASKLCN